MRANFGNISRKFRGLGFILAIKYSGPVSKYKQNGGVSKYIARKISLIEYLASNGNLLSIIRKTSFFTSLSCPFYINSGGEKLDFFWNFANFVAGSATFAKKKVIYSEIWASLEQNTKRILVLFKRNTG